MAQVRDIVCGMTVDSDTAQHKSKYKGQTYYFCAPGCKSAFDKEPEKYLQQDTSGQPVPTNINQGSPGTPCGVPTLFP